MRPVRPADRLFQIVLLLSRGRVLTAHALAGRLRVSVRTVYRDIQDLVQSGVPVEGEPGVGYCLRSGYQVPPMMFDPEELQALVFGAGVARAWGDAEMADAADRILAKIEGVLPAHLRPRLNAPHLVVPEARMSEAAIAVLHTVRDAINRRRRITLDYRDVSSASTRRTVWPLALAYWGASWTLGAWCELRGDFRNFRIDRVAGIRLLPAEFPDEPGKRLKDYYAAVFGE
jgi:predicted DNA-binding transcriptional regulator YafY